MQGMCVCWRCEMDPDGTLAVLRDIFGAVGGSWGHLGSPLGHFGSPWGLLGNLLRPIFQCGPTVVF